LCPIGHPVLDLGPVVAHLLVLGHPVLHLSSIVAHLPGLGLSAIVAHLLAVGHASLTLDAIRPNLLALGRAVLDAFDMGRPLRHPLHARRTRLAFDAHRPRLTLLHCGTRRALHVERLARRGTALGCLRTLAGLGGRRPLTLDLVVGVAATRASRCRRRNRQRGDACGEE